MKLVEFHILTLLSVLSCEKKEEKQIDFKKEKQIDFEKEKEKKML